MDNSYSTDDLRNRLRQELSKRGLSFRTASLNAGLSRNYVHSLLSTETEPTVQKVCDICLGNGISLTYVLLGFEMSEETRQLVVLADRDPEIRRSMLTILERTVGTDETG